MAFPENEQELAQFVQQMLDEVAKTVPIIRGSGSPNGAVVANPGVIYQNTAGGAGVSIYVKESGVGTNTGWVGK